MEKGSKKQSIELNLHNYKDLVFELTKEHLEQIEVASLHFKEKVKEYTSMVSNPSFGNIEIARQKKKQDRRRESSSSEKQNQAYLIPTNKNEKATNLQKKVKYSSYKQWSSQLSPSISNYTNLNKYYQELFEKGKIILKTKHKIYDFKDDQKQMLTNIFQSIKTEEEFISFDAVIDFFSQCKLFYLYYNIKPFQALDIIKEFAHTHQDKLDLQEFLNIFFFDRPNLTSLDQNESIIVSKKCIMSPQTWKQLKNQFQTLDTFGNEIISMASFLHRLKHNKVNYNLLNEPAIEYSDINRTIPIKKIIFNLQNRYVLKEKISWLEIQEIFRNFDYHSEPTIDTIYNKKIQRGQITKFTNYFMINQSIIEQIKNIYKRCPKYCFYFIKTKFICHELLQSIPLKGLLKVAVVRIINQNNKDIYINLQDQIRHIASKAESYIDLDELLEYISIKGPINTKADLLQEFSDEESSEEQEQRISKKMLQKRNQKLEAFGHKERHFKLVRHLTAIEQFNLTKKRKEAIMQKKTREYFQQKEREVQNELNKKFKSNPIPSNLNPQNYKRLVQKQQQKKEQKRNDLKKKRIQQNNIYKYLKAKTRLFQTKEQQKGEEVTKYKFKHKEIPWFVYEFNLLSIINKSKELRKKTLYQQKKIKYHKAWMNLPDAARIQREDEESSDSLDKLKKDPNSLQQPVIKRKEVPDFQKLHKQFEQELNKKKKQFIPTVPIGPNLSFHSSKQRTLQNCTSPLKQQKNIKKTLPKSGSIQQIQVSPLNNIPTTIKYKQMVNCIQNKRQEKQNQLKRLYVEEKERKLKQQNFARFMRSKLKESLHKSASMHALVKHKSQHKENKGKAVHSNQSEMFHIYSRVMNRPFLFEMNSASFNNEVNIKKGQKESLLKKKTILKILNQQESKHIHQSPLKFQPQNDQTPKNGLKNDLNIQNQESVTSQRAYFLNGSF